MLKGQRIYIKEFETLDEVIQHVVLYSKRTKYSFIKVITPNTPEIQIYNLRDSN